MVREEKGGGVAENGRGSLPGVPEAVLREAEEADFAWTGSGSEGIRWLEGLRWQELQD